MQDMLTPRRRLVALVVALLLVLLLGGAAASARTVVGSVDRPVDTFPALFGEAIWSFATDAEVRASPVIVDGTVLIGSYDGFRYALDIESGLGLWRVDRATAISNVTVTVSNGLVYFGDFNGQVNVVRSPADGDE